MPRTDPRPVLDRSGLVVVDKPAGMTSHDVVSRLRRTFGTRRVGHSGTLDPIADGFRAADGSGGGSVLRRGIGRDLAGLGATQEECSDDAEGGVRGGEDLAEQQVRDAFARQTGEIMQRPSSVSSVKINGRRAHELVREGVDVVLPERPVTVFSLDVDAVRISEGSVEADIRVHCSSGTYIRSIARDVGAELEVGGHLTALRRTSAGPFDIAEARTLDELNRQKDAVLASSPEGTDPRGVSPELSLSLDRAMVRCFPVRNVTEDQGSALALGKWLEPVGDREVVAAVTPSGHAVALLEEKGKRAASVFVARPAGME